MENYGTDGAGHKVYHVFFYPNLPLSENKAVPVHVFYTGLNGSGGDAKFEARYEDTATGIWYILGHGFMPFAAGHAKAIAEVYVDSQTNCPTLTNGSPYQNFGTNAAGNIVDGDKINLTNPSGTAAWTGSPETFGLNGLEYWLTELSDWPASFRSNGPAAGPP